MHTYIRLTIFTHPVVCKRFVIRQSGMHILRPRQQLPRQKQFHTGTEGGHSGFQSGRVSDKS